MPASTREASQPASAKSSCISSFCSAGESLEWFWSFSEAPMMDKKTMVLPTPLGRVKMQRRPGALYQRAKAPSDSWWGMLK